MPPVPRPRTMTPACATAIAIAFSLVLASNAIAQPSARLTWNGCAGTPGATGAASFTGPATYRQVVSGSGFTGTVRGCEVTLRLRAPGGVPDSWRIDAAGCQAGAVTIASASTSKTCPTLGNSATVVHSITRDPVAGSIDVRMTAIFPAFVALAATSYTLFRLDFDLAAAGVTCGGADAPVCFSIVDARWLDGDLVEHELPVDGGSVTWNDPANTLACGDLDLGDLRIDEAMTACANGDSTLQFVELVANRAATHASSLRLQVRDRDGALLLDASDLFPGLDGQAWPAGRRWLIATSRFAVVTGVTPDLILPLPMDREAGSISLIDPRPGAPVVHELAYGHPGEPPAPPPGGSLRRSADGTFAPSAFPDGTNATGITASVYVCPSDADKLRIREFAIDCAGCGRQGKPFVELVATETTRYPAGLRLILLSSSGVSLYNQGLFTANLVGQEWPAGRTWLVGDQASLPAPDKAFANLLLDDEGGTIRLFDSDRGGIIVDEIRYGHSPSLPPPPPHGGSIVRVADGQYAIENSPTPTRADGQLSAPPGCYGVPEPPPLAMAATRVAEIGLACDTGNPRSQYLELVAIEDQVFAPGMRLVYSQANGGERTVDDPFGSVPDGTLWPAGKRFLFASALFAQVTGFTPDAILPVGLVTDLGRVRIEERNDCEPRTIDRVEYGVPGAPQPPSPGRSLVRAVDGSLVEGDPSPARFDGKALDTHVCPACPVTTLHCGGTTTYHEAPAGQRSTFLSSAEYDLPHGVLRAHGGSHNFDSESGSVWTEDTYLLAGPPDGTVVDFAVGLEFSVSACGGFDGGGGGFGLVRGGEDSVEFHFHVDRQQGCDGTVKSGRLELRKTVGVPFQIVSSVNAGGSYGGSGSATMRFAFVDLPPGTRITSCHGYVQDGPTATRTTLIDGAATPGGARLTWHSSAGAELEGIVERRTQHSEWVAVGTLRSDASGMFAHEESHLTAGGRYAWRLGVLHDGVRDWSDPAWLDVPAALRFAIRGLAPNPSTGDAWLTFELARTAPVRIEIVDVQGRIVLALEPGVSAPGPHVVRLAGAERLGAGVYFVRLLQGSDEVKTKFIRVR